ncbi:acyl-[acyl-carrier-protein]--UDP-N-acetylglucosamine O-acyltransferase [Prosthecobacter fusiformis]|uniref:Acyl-[acyl-carrier-protein]--UDP-N-acetylglucosamine O-acyltransferase n=1 Tax=Prosthecobacter fusiformis TaxID=48464 RepID=A0A4R7RR71_9BACT|nr:acyl-ACP--UDP-N-acetylglucosamine O-acyltransferase [Prosthecobacter fusiformis]TDU68021.1 acyl-[acyl-carrier-protein]--UDP-N-acetylglucosamine O-acyltransferase [Prosthecobacter fusiformis]
MSIHPTAIIDPTAKIGADVTVGPYCIIGAGVEIGDGSWLQHHVTVMGPTKIGKNNRFFAYGSIGQQTQDLKYSAEPTYLEIGDHNTFREFCSVHRATSAGDKTSIGSHNNFLSYVHIAHDCVVGNHVIFSNNGTLAGHVVVDDHVILGGLSAVHQFCRIGTRSIIGGCAKVVQDVPPYTTADGNPARARGLNIVGLRRAGFSREQMRSIRAAFRKVYRCGLNNAQAVAELRSEELTPEAARFTDFVADSKRGITPGSKAGVDEGDDD